MLANVYRTITPLSNNVKKLVSHKRTSDEYFDCLDVFRTMKTIPDKRRRGAGHCSFSPNWVVLLENNLERKGNINKTIGYSLSFRVMNIPSGGGTCPIFNRWYLDYLRERDMTEEMGAIYERMKIFSTPMWEHVCQ